MDINFELYKIFYHAARKESFSQAAAELFISQSAVSQAIKNLETQLGSELFFRKTRNLRLSPEVGRTTVVQHQRIVRAIRDRDVDAAERAMTTHLSYLRTQYSARLESSRSGEAPLAEDE